MTPFSDFLRVHQIQKKKKGVLAIMIYDNLNRFVWQKPERLRGTG
jgi:hypothetical protein